MNNIDSALSLTHYYLYNIEYTDAQLLPDIFTIEICRDSVMDNLYCCGDMDDFIELITYTENIVTMLRAKECNCEFFEILHDFAVVTLINLSESCDVVDTYMYGWEAYIGCA